MVSWKIIIIQLATLLLITQSTSNILLIYYNNLQIFIQLQTNAQLSSDNKRYFVVAFISLITW